MMTDTRKFFFADLHYFSFRDKQICELGAGMAGLAGFQVTILSKKFVQSQFNDVKMLLTYMFQSFTGLRQVLVGSCIPNEENMFEYG